MFRFERLEVWQRARDFAKMVYEETSVFPRSEQYGLTSQTRRSASSIPANIAEGSSRTSDKDFSRFVEIAYGSLCETVSHLRIAETQGFISEANMHRVYGAAESLARRLTSFRNSLGKWKSVAEEHVS